jgi:hypothetical protein
MAIYKVGCGHCGDNNIHEAGSDEESIQKHVESKSHVANKADFDNHMSNFTHGKEHN